MKDILESLDVLVRDVIAPLADRVDREGAFPTDAIKELGKAGFLGLTAPADLGGGGRGLREAAAVVEKLSTACGSTAMIMMMHYAAAGVIVALGPPDVVADLAGGAHLSTLAFSEAGSRSHFWVPLGSACEEDGVVRLDATKSWVTSSGHVASYVWSSRPTSDLGPMSLWLVPADTPGLRVVGGFDGMGLRGNASGPVLAEGARLTSRYRLGDDGQGLALAMDLVLPTFLVLSGAFGLGLARATLAETVLHVSRTRLEHLDRTLVEQPMVAADLGRMQIEVDCLAALLSTTIDAIEAAPTEAMLSVLEVKAAAAEAALAVTDTAMKICGGAAFRRELGIERRFRDARAARVMAPTTDRLLDFVARSVCGLPLLERS